MPFEFIFITKEKVYVYTYNFINCIVLAVVYTEAFTEAMFSIGSYVFSYMKLYNFILIITYN